MKLAGGRTITDGREAATGRVTGQGYAEAAVAYGFKDATERVTSIVSDPVAAGPDEGLAYEYDGDMPKSVTATGTAAGRYEYGYGAGLLMNSIKLVSGSTTLDTPITRDDDGLVTGLGTFTFTRTNNDANLRIAESTLRRGHGVRRPAAGWRPAPSRWAPRRRTRSSLTRNARGQIERKVETVGATTTEYLYTYDDDAR